MNDKKKLKLIPAKNQFLDWSIPNKVTYIAFWLAILSLVFGLITFFIPNDNSEVAHIIENHGKIVSQQGQIQKANKKNSSSLLINNLLDKVYEELRDSNNIKNRLSAPLVERIVSLSLSLEPYHYFVGDSLIQSPLSPERGLLLTSLIKNQLDRNNYREIFRKGDFKYSDISGAKIPFGYLEGIDLQNSLIRNSQFKGVDLKDANLKNATFLNVNFDDAILVNLKTKNTMFSKCSFKYSLIFYEKDFNGENDWFSGVRFDSCYFEEYYSPFEQSVIDSLPINQHFTKIIWSNLNEDVPFEMSKEMHYSLRKQVYDEDLVMDDSKMVSVSEPKFILDFNNDGYFDFVAEIYREGHKGSNYSESIISIFLYDTKTKRYELKNSFMKESHISIYKVDSLYIDNNSLICSNLVCMDKKERWTLTPLPGIIKCLFKNNEIIFIAENDKIQISEGSKYWDMLIALGYRSPYD